jgi:hypothetical protein
MNRSIVGHLATATLAVAALACGGDGDSTGPGDSGNGASRLRAKVDGVAWASEAGAERFGVPISLPGLYSITGSKTSSGNNYTISIGLYNIGAPGTYPLGVGPQVAGGSAIISNAAGGWSTPQSGSDGTITITTLTASRIVGTFNFTANALSGSATGAKTITDGDFDLEVKPTGMVGALPDNAGSKVSATINGVPYNAAAVAGSYLTTSGGILVVSSANNARSVGLSLGGVTGAGTYAFSNGAPTRSLTISNVASSLSNTWSTLGAGGGGSVTVTSITATRMKGTFSATLGPAPGFPSTGTVTVTNGVFDVGRQ